MRHTRPSVWLRRAGQQKPGHSQHVGWNSHSMSIPPSRNNCTAPRHGQISERPCVIVRVCGTTTCNAKLRTSTHLYTRLHTNIRSHATAESPSEMSRPCINTRVRQRCSEYVRAGLLNSLAAVVSWSGYPNARPDFFIDGGVGPSASCQCMMQDGEHWMVAMMRIVHTVSSFLWRNDGFCRTHLPQSRLAGDKPQTYRQDFAVTLAKLVMTEWL